MKLLLPLTILVIALTFAGATTPGPGSTVSSHPVRSDAGSAPVLEVRSPPDGARLELYTDRLVVLLQGNVVQERTDRTLLVNVSATNGTGFPRQDHLHFGFDLEGNFTPTTYGGKASLCYATDCPIAVDQLTDGAHVLEARVHRADHSPYADATAGKEIHVTLVKFDRAYSESPPDVMWIPLVVSVVVLSVVVVVALYLLRSRNARRGCIVEDVFLIYQDGRLIDEAHRAGPGRTVDPGVLASMLTAVLEFIKDSMKTEEGVRGFDYGTRRVMIAARGRLILAIALYGRENPDLRVAAENLLVAVERRWPLATSDWDGSGVAFSGVREELSALLKSSTGR